MASFMYTFDGTIVFHFYVIIDSFQKTFSDFGHFEQLYRDFFLYWHSTWTHAITQSLDY